MTSDPSSPTAVLSDPPKKPAVWWIPAGAALLVLALLAAQWARYGPQITLVLAHGHGLSPGDPVRSRGVVVGEVLDVRLEDSGRRVAAEIRLRPEAQSLAQAGSLYWVQRPRVGWNGIEGLETLTGPVYVSALPGSGAPQKRFEALAEAPVLDEGGEDGLELILEAPRSGHLAPGAPLLYRQIPIGRVLSVALSQDATGVRLRSWVDRRYQPLIRSNTVFWLESGAEFDAGLLSGVSFRLDSLQTFIGGAVALATPAPAEKPVGSGHRFSLLEEMPKDAAKWAPPMSLDAWNVAFEIPLLLRATVQTGKAGLFRRASSRSSWICPVEGGFLMPADLLPENGRDPVILEAAGERVTLGSPPSGSREGVVFLPMDLPNASSWPADRQGRLESPAPCLVVADPALEPLTLEPQRLTPGPQGLWRIDPALSFSLDLHGAAVLQADTGKLIGLLLVQEGSGKIAPLPR